MFRHFRHFQPPKILSISETTLVFLILLNFEGTRDEFYNDSLRNDDLSARARRVAAILRIWKCDASDPSNLLASPANSSIYRQFMICDIHIR